MKITDQIREYHKECSRLRKQHISLSTTTMDGRSIQPSDILDSITMYKKKFDGLDYKVVSDFEQFLSKLIKDDKSHNQRVREEIQRLRNKEIELIEDNFGDYHKLSYLVLEKDNILDTIRQSLEIVTIFHKEYNRTTHSGNIAVQCNTFVTCVDSAKEIIKKCSDNVYSSISTIDAVCLDIEDLEALENALYLNDNMI